MLLGRQVGEHDLRAVGRPLWIPDINGRISELHGAASIAIGLPENTFGKGDVSHEPTIFREGHRFCRNAAQEGDELFALRVKARKLASTNYARGKDLPSVLSNDRLTVVSWAGS